MNKNDFEQPDVVLDVTDRNKCHVWEEICTVEKNDPGARYVERSFFKERN